MSKHQNHNPSHALSRSLPLATNLPKHARSNPPLRFQKSSLPTVPRRGLTKKQIVVGRLTLARSNGIRADSRRLLRDLSSFVKPFLILLMAWICHGSLFAQPVILYLRGGDRLTGTIVTQDTNRVVLSTKWSKEMIVPVSEILKREPLAASPESKAQNSTVANGAALTNSAPRPGTAVVSGPMRPTKAGAPKRWSGEAQVGLDLAFSQKERQLYSGRLKAAYAQQHFRNIFDYSFTYGKTDGLLSDNRMFGSSKTDFDLGERPYVYHLGGAGYDEIRKIDMRFELGPGVGYHLVKRTNLVVNTEVGVNYQAQYQSDHTQSEMFYHRLAEFSNWAINGRFSVDEKFEFFPQVEDWERYRFRAESNLRCALLNNLAFVVTALDQYDTQPAQGVPKNDLQVRSSISVKF